MLAQGDLSMQSKAAEAQSAPVAQGSSHFVPSVPPVAEKRPEKQWNVTKEGNITKVFWTPSAPKFVDTRNKNHNSPPFKLTFPDEPEHSFVIILKPLEERGSNFRKGSVTVKCETTECKAPRLAARIGLSIGDAEAPVQDNDFKEYTSIVVKRNVGLAVEKGDVWVWEFWSGDKPKAADVVALELSIEPLGAVPSIPHVAVGAGVVAGGTIAAGATAAAVTPQGEVVAAALDPSLLRGPQNVGCPLQSAAAVPRRQMATEGVQGPRVQQRVAGSGDEAARGGRRAAG